MSFLQELQRARVVAFVQFNVHKHTNCGGQRGTERQRSARDLLRTHEILLQRVHVGEVDEESCTLRRRDRLRTRGKSGVVSRGVAVVCSRECAGGGGLGAARWPGKLTLLRSRSCDGSSSVCASLARFNLHSASAQ